MSRSAWAVALVAIAFALPAGTAHAADCTISWKAAVSGDWSDASKWDATPEAPRVPHAGDVVCITVAPASGRYTVTATGADGPIDVGELIVGPSVGADAAVLSIRGRGCQDNAVLNAANVTTNLGGTIQLTSVAGTCSGVPADVNLHAAGAFTNAGKVTVDRGALGGTRELSAPFLDNTGSIAANVTTTTLVPGMQFNNRGSMTIADGATFRLAFLSSFFNDFSGSITDTGDGRLLIPDGSISQFGGPVGRVVMEGIASNLMLFGPGAGTFVIHGMAQLTGDVAAGQSLVIEGVGCDADYPVSDSTLTAPAGFFQNSGSVVLTNAEGDCAEGHNATVVGDVINLGTLATSHGAAGGGRSIEGNVINFAAFNVGIDTSSGKDQSFLDNFGTVNIASGATLSLSHANESLTNEPGAAVVNNGQLRLVNGFLQVSDGPVGPGRVVLDGQSSLALTGSGAGTFVLHDASKFAGDVAAGQSLLIESLGCTNGAAIATDGAFTNAGKITLTNARGSCISSSPASLTWPGTLVNTGTITVGFGLAGGVRVLTGDLLNSGALNVNTDALITGPTIVNAKTVTLSNGEVATAGATEFDNTAGTISTTNGSLRLQDTKFDVGNGSVGTKRVVLEGGGLNLAGSSPGTFVFHGSSTLSGDVAAGQALVVEGVGCGSDSAVNALSPTGFTNAGSITLTNAKGTCTQARSASFSWSGPLTNNGTISSNVGVSGGQRVLGDPSGSLTNAKTLNVNSNTTFPGQQLINDGTLVLAAARRLSLDHVFAQGSTGTLVEKINSASSFGRLSATEGAVTDGKLQVDTLSTYAPTRGTEFGFLSGNILLAGPFASTVFNGHDYRLDQLGAVLSLVARDATKTTVALSAATTQVGRSVTATATVTAPAPGNPPGTVTFAASGAGTFTPAAKTCTLAATSTEGQSTCKVTFVPSAVGSQTLSASYDASDLDFASSKGTSPTLTVNKRTTSTAVACTPSTDPVNAAASCQTTVTDTNAGTKTTPAGTVTLTTNGTGTFSATSCTLAKVTTGVAACTVTYKPTTTGTHTVAAAYHGDVRHLTSSGGTPVTVTTRPTTTALACSPAGVATGSPTTCTATVTDISVSTPTGSVTFKTDGAGAFSPAATCTLAATSTSGKATCKVTYAPSAKGTGTHTITATYNGDTRHATSTKTTNVTVT